MIPFSDIREYKTSTEQMIRGSVTRGWVASVKDPLYSGRVKVYIPTLHGGNSTGITGGDEIIYNPPTSNQSANDAAASSALIDISQSSTLALLSSEAIEALPWASVIGFGWGPTGQYNGDVLSDRTGVFCAPKVGTEVIVVFEQDDPNYPIIIGSVFHYKEALSIIPKHVSMLAPGVRSQASLPLLSEDNYTNLVGNVFIARSEEDTRLVLSDIPGQSEFSLSKPIPFRGGLGISPLMYEDYKKNYPNFPTTASSPLAESSVGWDQQTKIDILSDNETLSKLVKQGSTEGRRYPINTNPVIPTNGKFRATRTNSITGSRYPHTGIDLATPVGTDLVAPYVCYAMLVSDQGNAGGGLALYVKGDDDILHAFMHLSEVDQKILDRLRKKEYMILIEPGEVIGKTGNTGKSSGPHLHWETFSGGEFVHTPEQMRSVHSLHTTGGSFSGTDEDGNVTRVTFGAWSYINPLDWLNGGAGIELHAGQIEQHAENVIYSRETSDRQFGLYADTVQGAESIFLRHPSGSYIGFDIDGNLQIFTVGDVNIKVNRSMHVDVLGGIITSCMTILTRCSSVMKTMAKSVIPVSWSDKLSLWPKVMGTMVTSRISDLNDAMKFSATNIKYNIDAAESKSVAEILNNGGFLTTPTDTPKSFDNSNFDDLIKRKHKEHIADDASLSSLVKKAITPQLLKCQMLKESNGNPDLVNSKGYVGLFQLGPLATKEIKNDSTALNYKSPEQNVDVAVQYMKKIAQQVVSTANKAQASVSYDDIAKLSLLGYIQGYPTVTSSMATISGNHQTPNYLQVEQWLIGQRTSSEALQYAPTIYSYMGKTSI